MYVLCIHAKILVSVFIISTNVGNNIAKHSHSGSNHFKCSKSICHIFHDFWFVICDAVDETPEDNKKNSSILELENRVNFCSKSGFKQLCVQYFPHMTCMQLKSMSRFCAMTNTGNLIYLGIKRV